MSDPTKPNLPGSCGHGCHSAKPHEPRRKFMVVSILAGLLGGVLGLIPMIPGIGIFVDPLLRNRKKKGVAEETGKLIRVGTVSSLPENGKPVQVPVIADLTDAWNREANQPIGSVFLRKLPDGNVACFNSICPHAGCKVSFAEDRNVFQCPCHTSSFELDGKRVEPSPSPRNMDELDVKIENGDIKVKFVNYLPGKANQVAK